MAGHCNIGPKRLNTIASIEHTQPGMRASMQTIQSSNLLAGLCIIGVAFVFAALLVFDVLNEIVESSIE